MIDKSMISTKENFQYTLENISDICNHANDCNINNINNCEECLRMQARLMNIKL